ncbi:head-tail connector protein [Sphingomonas endophytica]|uniref:Gene transfer agent protein n=1 Tax=Sphingomonas endophytica TaxID=869719 RepID=A0A147I3H7_9SPHN|nr:hypothetical protein [Sphingomonas endophytica]KTT72623.1 hypothetical protein NS334_08490 [Sphingomonas endophytica]
MLSEAVTVAAAVAEPIARADVKRFLRIDGDSLDLDVDMLIAAARSDVEQATGLRLVEQTVEIQADTFGDLDFLPIGPVQSIAEIRYRDLSGAWATLSPASYDLVGAGLERGIAPARGVVLPPTLAGRGVITARLVVGYGGVVGPMPVSLRWAMLALARGKFEDRAVDIFPLISGTRIGA